MGKSVLPCVPPAVPDQMVSAGETASVTLAAGALATNVWVVPVLDALVEGAETVTLTLSASAAYQRTALSNATIILQDRPVDAWRFSEFTPVEWSDPLVGGDGGDFDLDGLPNLLEYAFGLAPRQVDVNPLWPVITNGLARVHFSQAKGATDVTLLIEWSPDLVNWFSGPAYLAEVDRTDAGAVQWVTLQVVSPPASSPGFLRARTFRQ